MVRVAVLATVFSCEVLLNPTIAREAKKPLPPKKIESIIFAMTPDFADIDLRNKLESTLPEGLQKARRVLALYAADRAMELNPAYKNIDQAGRTELYNRYLDIADGAPVIPLTGGLGELAVKEILLKGRQAAVLAAKWAPAAAGSTVGPEGTVLGGLVGPKLGDAVDFALPSTQFLNGAATLALQNLENLSKPDQKAMTPAEVYFTNNAFDAFDTSKYAAVLSRVNTGRNAGRATLHPGVFMTRMYQNEIRRDTDFAQLKSAAHAQGRQLELAIALQAEGTQNQAKILELMNSEVVPMLKSATSDIKIAATFARAEMARQDLAQTRDQYTDPLNSIAGFAVLAGDFKVAKQAKSFATITGAAFDLAHMAGSFQKQPFKTVNLYLLIATTALDLFQGSKGDPQAAAMMEALRGLSEQIEQFRVEMHERFDRLEMIQAHYFHQTFLDLDQIESSQTSIRRAVENLQSDMKDLKATVTSSFDALAQDRIRTLNAHCLLTNGRGPSPVADAKEASLCFSGYLAYASGNQASLIQSNDSQFNTLDWSTLSTLISQSTGMPPIPAYDINQFINGSSLFATAMKRNPKWAAIGKEQVFADANQGYSLPALIAQGRAIETFYREMALEQKGDSYVLRKDLFDKLLSDYYRQIVEITSSTQASYAGVLRDWPDPAKKWELKPTEALASSTTLANKPITLCTVDKAIGSGVVQWRGRTFDGNPNPKVTEFNPNGMTTTKDFAEFLPPSVRWGDYFGALDRDVPKPFASFQLSACFNKASMDFVAVTRPSKKGKNADHSHIHATLGLDITAKYVGRNGNEETMVVTHLDANPKEDGTEFFDPTTGPGLLNMMWTGASAEDTQKHWRRSIMGPGIRANPKAYFTVNNDDKIKANLAKLEKELGDVFDSRRADLFRVALSTAGVAGKRLDLLRAQILYLVREGIDLSDDKSIEFYQGLVNNLPTTEAYIRWAIELSVDKAQDKFAKHFKSVTTSVNEIDREATLRPAPSRLGSSLELLEGIAASEVTAAPTTPVNDAPKPTSKPRRTRGAMALP